MPPAVQSVDACSEISFGGIKRTLAGQSSAARQALQDGSHKLATNTVCRLQQAPTQHDPAGRKSSAITTAKRLAQFLGDERIKDKGLNCNYVIARRPDDAPTSERAIPVAIFSTEPAVARSFLRRWCGHLSSGESFSVMLKTL